MTNKGVFLVINNTPNPTLNIHGATSFVYIFYVLDFMSPISIHL